MNWAHLWQVGHSRREAGLPFGHFELWQRTSDAFIVLSDSCARSKCLARWTSYLKSVLWIHTASQTPYHSLGSGGSQNKGPRIT